MAPAYKLTYGDAPGFGESIRYIFHYGGIDFEDNRLPLEEIPKIKDKLPFGQIPILEHNGKMVNQSKAIARFAGKLAKLGGDNPWEDLEIDAIVDTFADLVAKLVEFSHEKDEARKKELKKTVLTETVPYYLSRFEKILEENNGYFALKRLTWADLYVASMFPSFDLVFENFSLAPYPKLEALKKKVTEIPAIKKYIEKHRKPK